jgi:O-antigen/teichoic acid export membrane protein
MSQISAQPAASLTSDTSSSDQIILAAAQGGGIAFAGNLFVYLIRFAFGVVIARLLGAQLLGMYSLGMTFPEVAGTMALLGLGSGVARYIPIAFHQKDEARLWGIIQVGLVIPSVLGLVLALGIFLFADPIASRVYHQPALAPILRLASWAIPLLALITVLEAITQGFKRMEYKVYSEDITLNVLKLLLTVALVGAGLGVMGAVAAYLVALVVTVVMLFVFVNHLFSLNRPWQTAQRNAGELFHFSLPVYLSQFVNEFGGSIGTLVLGLFGTVSGVGIFTAASRLSTIGLLFYFSLMRIATPMVSDLHSRGKIDELGRMYQIMTKWGLAFNLPVFLTTAIFAQPLLSIFGQDFVSGAAGLTILAFASLFNASTGVCGTIVTMTGHSKLSLANSILSLVVTIGLDLLLIPQWGLVGAAVASALSVILLNVLRLAQVYLLLRIQPYNLSFLKPLAASLAAAGAAYIANGWLMLRPDLVRLVLGSGVLWGVYAGALVLLRLDNEDRLVLKRFGARFFSR